MLRVKPGVFLTGLRPEIVLAIHTAEGVWSKYGADELVVTSVLDGTHKRKSEHRVGSAVDLRIHNLPGEVWRSVAEELQERLTQELYDIILERDHIHVEYDPV